MDWGIEVINIFYYECFLLPQAGMQANPKLIVFSSYEKRRDALQL